MKNLRYSTSILFFQMKALWKLTETHFYFCRVKALWKLTETHFYFCRAKALWKLVETHFYFCWAKTLWKLTETHFYFCWVKSLWKLSILPALANITFYDHLLLPLKLGHLKRDIDTRVRKQFWMSVEYSVAIFEMTETLKGQLLRTASKPTKGAIFWMDWRLP